MPDHLAYGKTKNYRDMIDTLYHKNLDGITFTGTVKLHGQNTAFCYSPDGWHAQSRNMKLKDNKGANAFLAFCQDNLDDLTEIAKQHGDGTVYLFGEWCGGKIQNKTALSILDKRFVIFDIYIENLGFIEPLPFVKKYNKIENINDYKQWELTISMDYVEQISKEVKRLTIEVDALCPYLDQLNLKGHGEGIVWKNREHNLRFKSKGESYATVKNDIARVKTPVNPHIFDDLITNSRIDQAIKENNITSFKKSNYGILINWMKKDIKDENQDYLEKNNISNSVFRKYVSERTKKLYKEYKF